MSKDTIIALHAEHQGRWKNREELAERMIALDRCSYTVKKNIVATYYGRSLMNRSVIQILKAHRRTRVLDVELSVVNTFPKFLKLWRKLKISVLLKSTWANLLLNLKQKAATSTHLLLNAVQIITR